MIASPAGGAAGGGVRRQVTLPLSKAVELAWKNIRLRLARSLVVTGGIVLALAFLMSILCNDAVISGMRRRIAISPHEAAAQRLEASLRARGVPTAPAEIAAERLQQRWVVSLALLVAFVGILNAMLMSVTERFREIGTMKCLGALDGFIVKLFLIESLFQGLAGTLAGIAIGLAMSLGAMTLSYGSAAWRNVILGDLALGAALCLLVGTALTVSAAVYPAWKAARMQPIEAMRVEM